MTEWKLLQKIYMHVEIYVNTMKKLYGNWPAAVEMGKTAGNNAVGDEVHFVSFVSSVIFAAMNCNLFSCGNFSEDFKNYFI